MLASLGTIALVVQHTYTIPLSDALRLGTLSALELARQVLTVGAIVVLVVLGAGVLPLLAVVLAVNLAADSADGGARAHANLAARGPAPASLADAAD